MGEFSELYNVIRPFLNDAKTFIQAVAIIGAGLFLVINKARSMMANDEQKVAQMDALNVKIFLSLGFIFLVPTFITILERYFT